MTRGLVRYQQYGCLHFITFSCYRRQPYLRAPTARELFERSLEAMRRRYGFVIACQPPKFPGASTRSVCLDGPSLHRMRKPPPHRGLGNRSRREDVEHDRRHPGKRQPVHPARGRQVTQHDRQRKRQEHSIESRSRIHEGERPAALPRKPSTPRRTGNRNCPWGTDSPLRTGN